MPNVSENKPKNNKNLVYAGVAGLAVLVIIGVIAGVALSGGKSEKAAKNAESQTTLSSSADKSKSSSSKSEKAQDLADTNAQASSVSTSSSLPTGTTQNGTMTNTTQTGTQSAQNTSEQTTTNPNANNNLNNTPTANTTTNNNQTTQNTNQNTTGQVTNSPSNTTGQNQNTTQTNQNNQNTTNQNTLSQNIQTENQDPKKARETIENVTLLRFQKGPDFNPATAPREELKDDPLVVTMTALSFDNLDAKVGVSVKYSHIGDENFKEGRLVIKLDPRLKVDTSTIKDNFNNQGFKSVDGAVYNPETNEIVYGPGTFNTNPSQMKPGEFGEVVFKAIIPKGSAEGEYRITSQMVEVTTKQANPKNVIILDVKKAKV